MRRATLIPNTKSMPSSALGRLLAAGLLALALSIAQQHAVLHWLSHALGQAASTAVVVDKGAPATSGHCADCDAIASFDAPAPPPAALAFGPQAGAFTGGPPVDAVAPGTAPWLAYRSRAPPFFG